MAMGNLLGFILLPDISLAAHEMIFSFFAVFHFQAMQHSPRHFGEKTNFTAAAHSNQYYFLLIFLFSFAVFQTSR